MIGDVLFDAGYFHLAYGKLLRELLESNITEKNKRTGTLIKTLPGAVSFKLDLRSGKLPTCGHRRLHPKTAAAEVAWYLKGERDVTWLAKHCPIWNKFVEADGVTIKAAYGYRWREHFLRDQIGLAIKALYEDASNRRVYIGAWDPGIDGMDAMGQKNVPCPVGFTLSLVGDELHSSLMLRSSDVFVGLPYDVMGHVILMQVIVDSINARADSAVCKLGSAHFTLAHPHLYEAHWEMAAHATAQDTIFESPDLVKGWTVDQVMSFPDNFVDQYKIRGKEVKWPPFNPLPEVIP